MRTELAVSAGILLFATAGPIQAQTASFKADVPFTFRVGEKTLPAGSYVLQRMLGRRTTHDQTGMLVLKSTDEKVYEALITGTVTPPAQAKRSESKLVFSEHSGEHYLTQVWISGDEVAHRVTHVPDALSTDGEIAVPLARSR